MVLLRAASSGDLHPIPLSMALSVLSANFTIQQPTSVWLCRLGHPSPKNLEILHYNKFVVPPLRLSRIVSHIIWASPQDFHQNIGVTSRLVCMCVCKISFYTIILDK